MINEENIPIRCEANKGGGQFLTGHLRLPRNATREHNGIMLLLTEEPVAFQRSDVENTPQGESLVRLRWSVAEL